MANNIDISASSATSGSTRGQSPRRKPQSRRSVGRVISDVALLLAVVAIFAPLLLTVFASLRTPAALAQNPLGLPLQPTLDNFVAAFGNMNYLVSLGNTIVILFFSVILIVGLGALAAYPIARVSRKWTAGVYRLFILGMTLPVFVIIGPLYLLQRDLHLLDTRTGVVLTYMGLFLPVAIFFYTSFLRQIPLEMEEAAELDGAGTFRIFWTIVFPLMRPITATLMIYLALHVWNDLVVPLVFLSSAEKRTVMVNAYAFIDPYTVAPTELFPAAILGVLPLILVFAFMQRRVVQGLTLGAGK
ncbi:MAG: carbohydrate ABC transporter permease [Salinibacterium amurskyense]